VKAVILIGLVVIFTASGLAELVRRLRRPAGTFADVTRGDHLTAEEAWLLAETAERLFPGTDAEYFDGHTCVAGTPCSYEDNYLCGNARPPGKHRLGGSQSIGHDVIVATITDCEAWANGGAR